MKYGDLLRDPRWQRKRLEVMDAADWKCERCGDATTTLNVHHPRYVRGRKPWEYERSELECLCAPCHAKQHGIGQAAPPPAARTYRLVGGPADGKTVESAEAFPIVWVYEKPGEAKFMVHDAWGVVAFRGAEIASHFPKRGHPYVGHHGNEFAPFFRQKPYPELRGLYGWVQAGKHRETSDVLEWQDPDVIFLRLIDVQGILDSIGYDEAAAYGDEGVDWDVEGER